MQELCTLSPVQIHTLRACSLLVIPLPPDRVPPPGGFPTDLLELNLSSWATLVEDVVADLQVLPPNLGHDMNLPAVALLKLLETSTGVGFCHYCYHLGPRCICIGTYQLTPPQSWSQIVEQTPGYGVTASSGGMTTPSTTAAGMSGYLAPPLGLPPIDFSSWRLPPPEAPASRGLPAAPSGLPGVMKSLMLRGVAERNTRAQTGGLAQWAQTQSTSTPRMPQMVPPLHQPLPERPAMLYQQAVQLPKKFTGRGVASNPSADKTAPGAVHVHRTAEDLPLEGGEMVADPSVTPEACRGRRVCSHCIRRAICPPGQCPVFHHQWHLKEPRLSMEVSQGPPSVIPCDWQQNFAAVVGRSFLNTSSHIRRKPWASKKDARWILWHTSKTIFIRPQAFTWRASGVLLPG